MSRFAWSVVLIWALSLAAAVLGGLLAGLAFLVWTPVVLGALVLVTAAVQLSLQRKEGFVTRMAASLAGALVVLVAASAVLATVYPAAIPAVVSLD